MHTQGKRVRSTKREEKLDNDSKISRQRNQPTYGEDRKREQDMTGGRERETELKRHLEQKEAKEDQAEGDDVK